MSNYTTRKSKSSYFSEVDHKKQAWFWRDRTTFWQERAKKLAELLYIKGVRGQEIADHLKISRQAVSFLLPKNKLLEEGEDNG